MRFLARDPEQFAAALWLGASLFAVADDEYNRVIGCGNTLVHGRADKALKLDASSLEGGFDGWGVRWDFADANPKTVVREVDPDTVGNCNLEAGFGEQLGKLVGVGSGIALDLQKCDDDLAAWSGGEGLAESGALRVGELAGNGKACKARRDLGSLCLGLLKFGGGSGELGGNGSAVGFGNGGFPLGFNGAELVEVEPGEDTDAADEPRNESGLAIAQIISPRKAAPIQSIKEAIEPNAKVQRARRPRVLNGPEVSKGILRPISQPFTQRAATKTIFIQKTD